MEQRAKENGAENVNSPPPKVSWEHVLAYAVGMVKKALEEALGPDTKAEVTVWPRKASAGRLQRPGGAAPLHPHIQC